ncbi:FAD-binding oxidoreductase [Bacillus sp. PR5]|nr:FAD-binding oxidoreductase [Bacillus sp. PR5]
MTTSPHVVIIGAGTLGMCSAVNLIRQGARVTVIDANAIASGSSGRSVGVIGTQFTDPFEILLRQHSMRQFQEFERQGLRINHIGYLRLARTDEQMELFRQSVEMQKKAGFRSKLYQAGELNNLIPHLNPDGLAGAIFGPDDGFIDPHELCTLLAEKTREAGGAVRQFCKLEGVARIAGGYRLETTKGQIECDMVINAAGAWASQVAALFGQTLQVKPERHEAITILLDQPLDYTMPMVMDLVNGEGTGLNFRHEKAGELIAEVHKVTNSEPENPDLYNDQCEEQSRIELAELLLERVPDLPGARLGRGWAGLYPMTYDKRPLVGPVDPSEPTLVTAAGAGGYGIQLSPVIGQIATDWALHGAPVSAPGTEQLRPTAARYAPAA